MSRRLSKQAGPGPEDPVTQERAVAAIVASTLQSLADRIPTSVLESLDPVRIVDAVPWEDVGTDLMSVAAPLEVVVRRAALEEIPREALAKALDAAELPIDLEMVNQLAVQYAAQHSGSLVIEISSGLRETINSLITGNVAGDLPRNAVVSVLRAVLSLHAAWAQAVVKASAREYAKALEGGATLAAASARAERVANNRAAALTRRRALNIARTEAMTAMNEGKLAGWHEQVANGWASPDSVKEWVEGRDPCDFCRPLVGELVPYDQPFSNGRMMPPAHPNCRCTAALLPPDETILERMMAQATYA